MEKQRPRSAASLHLAEEEKGGGEGGNRQIKKPGKKYHYQQKSQCTFSKGRGGEKKTTLRLNPTAQKRE